MRYEDDLRGLQDITGKATALSPNPLNKPSEAFPFPPERPPVSPIASSSRMMSSIRGLSSSTARLTTPLGVRARLSSLGQNSPGRPIKKASSSSTITVRVPKKKPSIPHMRPFSPSSSEGSDSEDEDAAKEEEADRKLEEQEALDQKLKDLQKMITGDALGLVSSSQSKAKGKGKSRDRGRISVSTQGQPRSYRADELSSRSQSVSSAVSSASSPQGSIPSIPSPPPEAQFDSLARRHLSANKSSSPPVVSPRSAHGQTHPRYGPMGRRAMSSASEQESHGSSASSFSDLSGKCSSSIILDNVSDSIIHPADASLSASALESALMSNIRGGGSRL